MDKNAIKKYAVWARRELISRVSQKALQFGIAEKNIADASADSVNGQLLTPAEKRQRQALIAKIKDEGYEQVMEEVAYTWFNRFIALRFMEVNGYLPSRVRVFTDENNAFNPQILAEAIHLEMDGLTMEKVYAFKDANQTDELYKYLIITQCNALNSILPGMFQRIEDYTELLFPDNILREGSAIEQMISQIAEGDWKDAVQIIGWLYQYYNTEQNELVYDGNMSKSRISKELLPAATTIYTPDWAIQYMVQNSLGKLWIEGHPNDELKVGWKYYLQEAEQENDAQKQFSDIRKEYAALTPEQIKCIDPCSGSGHFLVYMFDVLMQIYESYGYTTREAVASIINNNLYGLDIDDRAAQLSYFAVMMKARQYDSRFFSRKLQPHVYAFCESNGISADAVESFCKGNVELKKAINTIMEDLHDAKEYGSILTVTPQNWASLYARFEEIQSEQVIDIYLDMVMNKLLPLVQVAEAMSQKYYVVSTNPPYLGSSRFSSKLDGFIKKNYADVKWDLSMVMLKKALDEFSLRNGFVTFITTSSWMFLSSFEKLRNYMLENTAIDSLVDFGTELFEGKVGHNPIVAWVNRKSSVNRKMIAIRLVDYCYSKRNQKKAEFFEKQNFYISSQKNFSKIPGSPVAYWVGAAGISVFDISKSLNDIANPKQGLITGNVARFVRVWFEIEQNKLSLDNDLSKKWFPYSNGGDYRKWYGNNFDVVNWENDGFEVQHFVDGKGKQRSRPQNKQFYFCEGGTWTAISSGAFSVRYYPLGGLFSNAGMAIFANSDSLIYLIALLNSAVTRYFLSVFSETLNYNQGDIARIPVILGKQNDVSSIANANICLSRLDWDAFETSWDFKRHPLLSNVFVNPTKMTEQEWKFAGSEKSNERYGNMVVTVKSQTWKLEACNEYKGTYLTGETSLKSAFSEWEKECGDRFNTLKKNEEELNRIFIDIYGLQDELTPEVEDKEVTVRLADKKRDIKSFISYAVGCMFGRYSLDMEGLAYAGGEWDVSKYTTFPADKDNILPICDDEYFDDDIVGRFIKFIEVVYGKETLDENMRFIADAVGGSGSPKDVIRSYFLNDFYADHLKIYQKRPIYWLFDSGKNGGFKALIYMHRYQPDTIARMRTDYVHEQQARYHTALIDLEQRIAGASTGERVKLNKQFAKLQAQDAEIREYEEKIHHLADQMIRIDLDDGVKHNYKIFEDVLAPIK